MVYVYTHAHLEVGGVHQMYSSVALYFFRQGLSLNSKLAISARLASQVPGTQLSPPRNAGLTRICGYTWL